MMSLFCPKCSSTNVVKNGFTHYGKQNHKCTNCSTQFVLDNTHTIRSCDKSKIILALQERISLRGICRVFKVSMTWLMDFAKSHWANTPEDLGVDHCVCDTIEGCQTIGLQLDELWSFSGNKKNKQWIWIAYDPHLQVTLACHIGKRGKEDAQKLWDKIPQKLKHLDFETDYWKAYEAIIPEQQHKVGKQYTYFIEGFNAKIRTRCSRLVRRSLAFSKNEYWHEKAIKWILWKFNLEKLNPYI